jgi:AraC-like DNA-binding protein
MPAGHELSSLRLPARPQTISRISLADSRFRSIISTDIVAPRGIAAEAVRLTGSAQTPRFVLPDLLALFVHSGTLRAEFGLIRHAFGQSGLAIIPAGTPLTFSSGAFDGTVVYLKPNLLMSPELDLPSRFDIVPQIDPSDIQLPFLIGCIRDELQTGLLGGRRHLEALGLAMLTHIFARYSVGRVPQHAVRGGLSSRQLRRAQDVMLATLDENLPLADIADEAGVSRWHFGRAFRQSTGLPPRKWLREKRVEQACRLLAADDRNLTSIALELGFASLSHFSTAFKQSIGVSPQRYRRALVG